jgi:hypothetical protein
MRRRDEDGERSTEAEASGWNARARWPGLESRGAATACTRAAAIGAGDGRSVGQRGGPSGREGKGAGDGGGSEGRRNGRGGGGAGVGRHQQEKWGVLWGFYGAFRRFLF